MDELRRLPEQELGGKSQAGGPAGKRPRDRKELKWQEPKGWLQQLEQSEKGKGGARRQALPLPTPQAPQVSGALEHRERGERWSPGGSVGNVRE